MIKAVARKILQRFPFIYRPTILTRRSIVWAYRLFLDRNPESPAVVEEKRRGPIANIQNLRQAFTLSREFAEKNPDLAPFPPQSIVIKELSCGRRLYVDLGDNVIGYQVVCDRYEQEFVELLPKLVAPAATVLDIGANIGFFSIHLAHLVGETGQVVAFEPIRELADLLTKSVAENKFQNRVVLETAALGDRSGHADMLVVENARNQGASYLVGDGSSDCPTSHELRRARMIALDDHDFRNRVSFIKMDIEGAEPQCVQGGSRLLRNDRPVVMSEIHPQQLDRVSHASPKEFMNQFASLDYRCFAKEGGRFRLLEANHPISGKAITTIFVPRENESAQQILQNNA